MPDWKQIGLAGKDVLMGVVTVAAGTTGGPAGAQGGQQMDRGLDGILGMAGVTKEPPRNRLNPERTDFAARQSALNPTATVAPSGTPEPVFRESVLERPKSLPPASVPTTNAAPPEPAIPQGVAQELARLGYSDTEVAQIAEGRFRPSATGETLKGADAQRLAQQEGVTRKSAESKPGTGFEGFNLGSVLGMFKGIGQG